MTILNLPHQIPCLRDRIAFFQEFAILWKRLLRCLRGTLILLPQISHKPSSFPSCFFVYFQVGDDTRGVLDRLGLLYFICVSLVATIGMPLWSVFAIHRNVYMRERAQGSYRVFPSYLAKFVCPPPFSMFLLFIFVVPLLLYCGTCDVSLTCSWHSWLKSLPFVLLPSRLGWWLRPFHQQSNLVSNYRATLIIFPQFWRSPGGRESNYLDPPWFDTCQSFIMLTSRRPRTN